MTSTVSSNNMATINSTITTTTTTTTTINPLKIEQKTYSVPVFRTNMDNEDDNPFRPGSELSREAEIIVNLIKEGKPITPTGDMNSANNSNNINDDNNTTTTSNTATPTKQQQPQEEESKFTKRNQVQTQTKFVNNKNQKSSPDKNNKQLQQQDGKTSNGVEPGGQVEIQHGVIVSPDEDDKAIEVVNLKKKSKCCRCSVQ